MSAQPRIALIGEPANDFGGSIIATGRMSTLLDHAIEMVPISFEYSSRPDDWAGTVRTIEMGNRRAYVIATADANAGNRLTVNLAERMLSRQLMLRARAEHVLAIAADENFDAVHAYGCYDDRIFVATYVASLLEKPLILTFCGQDLERNIFGLDFPHIRHAIDHAALITCKSEKAKRILCQVFKPKAEVRLIHNHISEDYFDQDAVIEPWGNSPIIGCFALFRRIVGLDVLLRAYTRLLGERELTLALGGPIVPADLEYFNRQIEALPENARVWRMGKVPHHQMLAAYRTCDLVVAPSYADACPHKVLEAMLAGTPIVGTTAGGIPELLTNEEEALLVEPGDDAALAQAIAQLLDNTELSQRLASRARTRVLTQFTRELEQSKWMSAYQSIGICT